MTLIQASNEAMTQASENFSKLVKNSYPGRIIVMGLDEKGNLIQLYAITGRSPTSRNRIFKMAPDGGMDVVTDFADMTKNVPQNSDLYVYTALHCEGNCHAVSNGKQTIDAAFYGNLPEGLVCPEFVTKWPYEGDSSYTPRITATCILGDKSEPQLKFVIAKKSLTSGSSGYNHYIIPSIELGVGYCIHTYNCDGDPLPSFTGEPYIVPLEGNFRAIANKYWDALNDENKVCLVVKSTDRHTGKISIKIINKYDKV